MPKLISYRPLPTSLPANVYASWVQHHMLSEVLQFRTVWDEVVEVFEALWCFDLAEAKVEAIQVWYTLQMWCYGKLGWDFKLRGCQSIISAHFLRFLYWHKIFKSFSVKPYLDLFTDGTNWRRPDKIQNTLSRVGIDVTISQACSIIQDLEATPTPVTDPLTHTSQSRLASQ
jgi:hypothetical protein